MPDFVPIAEAARKVGWDLSNFHKLKNKGLVCRSVENGKLKKWEVDIECGKYQELLAASNKENTVQFEGADPSSEIKNPCPVDWDEWRSIVSRGEWKFKPLGRRCQHDYKKLVSKFYEEYGDINKANLRKALSVWEAKETEDRDFYSSKYNIYTACINVAKYLVYKKLQPESLLIELSHLRPKKTVRDFRRPVHTLDTVRGALDVVKTGVTEKKQERYNPKRKALNEALIKLALTTGMRRSEIANLKLSDIDFKTGKIKVLGKGRKIRPIKMSKSTLKAVKAYLPYRSNPNALYLFQSEKGKQLTPEQFYKRLYRLGITCDIPKFNPHSMRRSYVRAAAQIYKIPLPVIRDSLGHTTLTMTNIYAQTKEEDVYNAMSQFEFE